MHVSKMRATQGTCTDCEQSLEAAGVSSLSVAGAPLSAPEMGVVAPAFASAAAPKPSFSMGRTSIFGGQARDSSSEAS